MFTQITYKINCLPVWVFAWVESAAGDVEFVAEHKLVGLAGHVRSDHAFFERRIVVNQACTTKE